MDIKNNVFKEHSIRTELGKLHAFKQCPTPTTPKTSEVQNEHFHDCRMKAV